MLTSRKRPRCNPSTRSPHASNGYVSLNVGGVVFQTGLSTLTSEPSKLADMARSNFAGLPVDDHCNPFIDRDPENFRHILNYLRGYHLPLSPDEVTFLAEDAEYFGLQKLMSIIGLGDVPNWSFSPGPGVSDDGRDFSSASIVGLCGLDYFSSGTHSITFRIEKCDVIGLGVVSRGYQTEHQFIFDRRNCICYLSTGDVKNFINDENETSGLRYKEGDIVTVLVEFAGASARVTFTKAGCSGHSVDVMSPVPELRFATFLQGLSVVHITSSSHSSSQLQ